MLLALWITFVGFLHSGRGLSHHARYERTRYVSSRNQIYGGSYSPNFDFDSNYIPFVHYWERPLQVLETSMNVPKKYSSRPLFSWDIPVPISTYTPQKKSSTTTTTTTEPPHNDVPFAGSLLQKSRSDRAKSSLAYHEGYTTTMKKKKSKQVSKGKESRGQNTNKRESKEKTRRMKKKGKKERKGKNGKKSKSEKMRIEMNDQVNEVWKAVSPCEEMEGKCEHGCEEVKGKAVCTCFRGFTPVGTKCLDINECETNNGGCVNGKCVNTLGSRKCLCSPGFRSVDGMCSDINECLLRNGHGPCQDRCINTAGSYRCTCDGLPGTSLSSNNHTCEDNNECSPSTGCSHSCISVSGRAFCTCPDGLELGDDWKTCHDIDECSNPEDYNVVCEFGCVNTVGSFICESS